MFIKHPVIEHLILSHLPNWNTQVFRWQISAVHAIHFRVLIIGYGMVENCQVEWLVAVCQHRWSVGLKWLDPPASTWWILDTPPFLEAAWYIVYPKMAKKYGTNYRLNLIRLPNSPTHQLLYWHYLHMFHFFAAYIPPMFLGWLVVPYCEKYCMFLPVTVYLHSSWLTSLSPIHVAFPDQLTSWKLGPRRPGHWFGSAAPSEAVF